MRRLLRLVVPAGLVAAETAAVAALHRLGQLPWLDVDLAHPLQWLTATAPEDAVVAVLRLVASASAWWLLATTLLYVAAHTRARPQRPARVPSRLTPRTVRRVIDRALAASVATAVTVSGAPIATPVLAAPAPPAVVVAADPPPPPGAQPPRADPRRDDPAPRVHVVAPGDHLWSIAAAQVGPHRPDRLRSYWLRVIAANRDRLLSGEPDLIFPGECVVLPRQVSRR